MAARTLTYTINMQRPAAQTHVGLNTIVFDFNSGATKLGTLSDVVLLGKIPNGAMFVSGDIQFGVQKSAATTWSLLLLTTDANGTFSTYATLAAAGSVTANASTVQSYHFCIPQKVSLSDDRAVQFVTLALNCTVGATETTSFSFQGSVCYLSDGTNV